MTYKNKDPLFKWYFRRISLGLVKKAFDFKIIL